MPVVAWDLTPLALLYVVLAISFVVGYAPAAWFVGAAARDDSSGSLRIFYMAPVLGFVTLLFCVFYLTQFVDHGTDNVALPVTAVVVVVGAAATLWTVRRGRLRPDFGGLARYMPLLIGAPFAAWNVLEPVVTGHWQVAYATGNDATRYLMMVRYLRTNVWHWNDFVGTAYPLWDRPLEHIAGATYASLFGITPALADTMAAATAAVLAAAAFCLLLEGLVAPLSWRERYLGAVVAVLALGTWGVTTEIFYTGYLGQHFSIMAMLGAFGFVAVRGNRQLAAWHIFWCVMLALCYSIILTGVYGLGAGVYLLLQARRGEWRQRLRWQVPALVSGGVLAALVDVGEHVLMTPDFVDSFSKTRDPGFAWSTGETILRWSGIMSRFELLDIFPRIQVVGVYATIGILLALSAWLAARWRRSQPGFATLCLVLVALPVGLQITGYSYWGHKLSLYSGFPLLLGSVITAVGLARSHRVAQRLIAVAPLAPMLVLLVASMRLMSWYWGLVDDRYTKVDSVMNSLVVAAHNLPAQDGSRKPSIYAVDYSPERHLLLQELMNDLPWQPLRQDAIWGEFHATPTNHPAIWDSYAYDGVLWAQTFRCEPIDLSGNDSAEVFRSPPFVLYGPRASTLEPIEGVDLGRGPWDADRNCYVSLLDLQPLTKLLFVNNGSHEWLNLTLSYEGTATSIHNGDINVALDDLPVPVQAPTTGPGGWPQVLIHADSLASRSRVEVTIDRSALAGHVGISSVRWGY